MQSSIVTKLLNLVTIVSESATPQTFSDILLQSGMNKSSLHRILSIAVQENLIQFDPNRKTYLLGAKVFDLVRNAFDGHDIQGVALDEMVKLQMRCGGNVTLGVPNGTDVVYLRVLEGHQPHGGFQRPGMREPVHCSASGKALCAFLPKVVVAARLDTHVFEKFTDRTIGSLKAFLAILPQVRQEGFAYNDREEYEHLHGISAPIFNYLGDPIAVLNIWAAYAQFDKTTLFAWAPHLVASAGNVTRTIGGRSPSFL